MHFRSFFFAIFLSIFSLVWGEIRQPSGFPIFKREGFTVQYDSKNKIPIWTWEILDKSSLEKNVDRKGMKFFPDLEVYPLHQSLLEDYRGSGYDRGHMVPAADVSFSKQALENSFLLTNVCPQNAQLNRGFWLKLERHIRDLIRKEGFQKVSVATGPLFLSYEENGKRYVKYEVIGKSEVAVPTHIFKLIHAKKEEKQVTWAYIVPNASIPKEESFEKFEVPIEKLEKASGLVFRKN